MSRKSMIIVLLVFLGISVGLNAFFWTENKEMDKKYNTLKSETELCRMITLKNAGGQLLVRCRRFGPYPSIAFIPDRKDETQMQGLCWAVDKTGTLKLKDDDMNIGDKIPED